MGVLLFFFVFLLPIFSLLRFASQEGVAIDFEGPGISLSAGTTEGIYRLADSDIHESRIGQHLFPACTRQATGDSSRPEIDIIDRGLGDGFAVGNVCELQVPARFQNPEDL